MALLIATLAVGILGAILYIRLAPSDPARWHIALPMDADAACATVPAEGSATAACILAEPPEDLLARLDAIALATPRTTRLAGSPAEGRITWVTRTRLWGFPDYTTAQVSTTCTGTRLDLFARLRFGSGDMGVNAARLTDWLARLTSG